jgi:hypothetical protein
VLERCYHLETNDSHKIIKQVNNLEGHSTKHFQLNIESRFIDVHCNGKLPEFKDEWYKILNVNDEEFLHLFNQFPSYKFRLEGFCMFTIEDVSKEMAVNQLKNAILNMHITDLKETLNLVELAIGELLDDAGIRIGVTPFFKINGKMVYYKNFFTKSIGISTEQDQSRGENSIEQIYSKLCATTEPYIYTNIDKDFVISRSYISDLAKHDIKNVLVYPIVTKRDGVLGVFELEKSSINSKTIDILQPALPLITDLIYYMIDTFDNRIKRIVKEKFTPLQPSVEWKFNEAAWKYLQQEADASMDEAIGNVVFKQVNPLYGAVDIRDSSVERNAAVKTDYLNQLSFTLALLKKASKQVLIPLVDTIQFKCEEYIQSVKDFLTTEAEIKINEFLQREVIIFFKYLASRFPTLAADVEDYLQKTDVNHGEFYRFQKAYESTLQKINKSIVTYFEDEVERMQSVYPFYFEKFRTDGVEYNIYIGQSIVPDNPFNPIYLENLKLWQLKSMADIARMNHTMLSELPIPLRTTQLILVHNYPIDISFRKDERRFDVEGSYNIRYEVVKKRIDKVRVKRTLERLTQPDKIAIVYSNSVEVEEYMQHISFLINKGVLTDAIETLELEDLQGVSGLKALRVGVQYNS